MYIFFNFKVLKGVLKASDEDSLDVNGNLFTFSQDPTDQTYNGNFQLFNRDGQNFYITFKKRKLNKN